MRNVGARFPSHIRLDLGCDVFDRTNKEEVSKKATKQAMKRGPDGELRSLNRITYFVNQNAFDDIDRYTKILYLQGEGEAFMLPSSNLLVNIRELFNGKIVSVAMHGRIGKISLMSKDTTSTFGEKEVPVKEFSVSTEGWVNSNESEKFETDDLFAKLGIVIKRSKKEEVTPPKSEKEVTPQKNKKSKTMKKTSDEGKLHSLPQIRNVPSELEDDDPKHEGDTDDETLLQNLAIMT